MIDVLKAFYSIHYNFAAVSILLLALNIFLLTKKNYKWTIIFTAVLIAFNVFLYKRTDGKAWTLQAATVKDVYGNESKGEDMTFSVHKNWVSKEGIVVDQGDTIHHWCWVDAYWDQFANTDLVAAIWGENSSKKLMKSTENRANDASNQQ